MNSSPQTKTILSIQSHVAYGHVGNCAAIFPLQIMGYEVINVNTVQFSNHTGYESHTGMVFEPRHIEEILVGLEERGLFNKIDAVLSGYMGNADLGHIVQHTVSKIREQNPNLIYCCDPVMGDIGSGFYVPEKLQLFFAERALTNANIITPNQFELSYLSDTKIKTIEDAKKACQIAHDNGPEIVLLTSMIVKQTKKDEIQMLVSQKGGRQWIVSTPKLNFEKAPNGAGDMTSAIFLGHMLSNLPIDSALKSTAASVFKVFEKTKLLERRELALVPAQDCFKNIESEFIPAEL